VQTQGLASKARLQNYGEIVRLYGQGVSCEQAYRSGSVDRILS